MPTELKLRAVVHGHGGTKDRKGVVMRIWGEDDSVVFFAFGQGTFRRGMASVEVNHASPEGRHMKLSKHTIFYADNSVRCKPSDLDWDGFTTCPIGLFLKLKRLFGFK